MKSLKVFTTGVVLATSFATFNNEVNAGVQNTNQKFIDIESIDKWVGENQLVAEEGNVFGVGRPSLQPKSVNTYSKGDTLDYKIEKKGNSIEQTITLAPEDTNATIEIPFDFQDGEYIQLIKDEYGNFNGAGNVYNKENESIALLYTPQIKSELGATIHAEVSKGNVLQLHVEASEAKEPVTVAMKASVKYYKDYFSGAKWITRDGMISLSITHKPYLTSGKNNAEVLSRRHDSWVKLKAVHSGNSKWKNESGLKKQYDCHHDTIGSKKNPWNIEPSRPNVSYPQTLLAACNPS
ncbi:hypothetical protein OA45_03070 [Bacillus sp. UMTAT18]|uniref:DUF2599 domain-containing protein n=1 Tax=Bacillus TaxID=1386 RepID=UPI00061872B2|nr:MULTISPECIES: DUF2599 domain-containing protein [Bacillus]KKC54382.1 hypothetical protein OA45_03070 [Bacillus sp. UMTAT18]MDA1531142.1 DUF2599 domain-containing protein [Bacillus cereus group sp. TH260-2LC]OJD70513.1 hypothetical protein BAU29_12080 [Bacillus sp. P14-1]